MNKFALVFVFSLASMSLSGCGRMVSRSAYLDTMMADRSDSSVMAYVPPSDAPAASSVNRNGVVLATDLRLDDPIALIDASPSSRATQGYHSAVRREIETLTREMRLLESRAELKGAPSRAALEPKLRTFNSAVDVLKLRLGESRGFYNQLEVDLALTSAQDAAREAHDVVNITRGLGENRSGT